MALGESGDPEALPAAGHPSAPVAYMVSDMYSPGAVLDYPKGGMGAAQTRRDMMRHAGNPGPGENKLCLEALGHEFGIWADLYIIIGLLLLKISILFSFVFATRSENHTLVY